MLPPGPSAVTQALELARAAAAKGSSRALERRLGILRGVTVEMGASPPVLTYGFRKADEEISKRRRRASSQIWAGAGCTGLSIGTWKTVAG
jgi:hypothetical protein